MEKNLKKSGGKWTLENSAFVRGARGAELRRFVFALLIIVLIVVLDTVPTAARLAVHRREAKEISHGELEAVTDPKNQLTVFAFSANREESEEFTQNPLLRRLMLTKDGSPRLTVTPLSYFSSGVEAAAERSGEVKVKYDLMELEGGKYLLFKRSAYYRFDSYSGTVGYMPGDIREKVLEAGKVSDGELLPLFFDATGEGFADITTHVWFSALIFLFGMLWLFFVMRRLARPDKTPAYQRLYICLGSLEENAMMIDEELDGPNVRKTPFSITTANWYITKRPFSFLAEPKSSTEKKF